jgi:tetratricopeptide (TPR) repeat protein
MRIWVVVVLALCFASPAFAGDKATAEAAFQQGKDLMKAGKFADACTAFEKSQALDAQLGTEYNLATCYEKAGRLASAWAEFRELAQRDSNAARKADSEKHAAALQPRLIKLLISVRQPVGGLKVTRNGEDVSQSVGIESPVDPGDYEIGAVADGYKPWSVKVSAKQEGGTVQVTVPELEKAPEASKPIGDHDMKPLPPNPGNGVTTTGPAPSSSRKLYGLIAGGAGVAITGVGLFFGSQAMSKWNDAKNLCGGDPDHCSASGDDFTKAQDDQKSAKSNGTISTVLVGVGVAALATGVVLYLTAPAESAGPAEEAFQIVPTVGPDGVGMTAVGRF